MLRKICLTTPPEHLDALKRLGQACEHYALWWCVDDNPEARLAPERYWPYNGSGEATLLLAVDDEDTALLDVLAQLRVLAAAQGLDPGLVSLRGSYVFLPDGAPPAMYEALGTLVPELHAAEAAAAAPDAGVSELMEVQRLREELRLPLARLFEFGEAGVASFVEEMDDLGFSA